MTVNEDMVLLLAFSRIMVPHEPSTQVVFDCKMLLDHDIVLWLVCLF